MIIYFHLEWCHIGLASVASLPVVLFRHEPVRANFFSFVTFVTVCLLPSSFTSSTRTTIGRHWNSFHFNSLAISHLPSDGTCALNTYRSEGVTSLTALFFHLHFRSGHPFDCGAHPESCRPDCSPVAMPNDICAHSIRFVTRITRFCLRRQANVYFEIDFEHATQISWFRQNSNFRFARLLCIVRHKLFGNAIVKHFKVTFRTCLHLISSLFVHVFTRQISSFQIFESFVRSSCLRSSAVLSRNIFVFFLFFFCWFVTLLVCLRGPIMQMEQCIQTAFPLFGHVSMQHWRFALS